MYKRSSAIKNMYLCVYENTHTAHTCLQKAVSVFLWDTLAWLAWPGFMTALADTSPRQRIQNLSRFVWKQATVASELWEKLAARCVDQHRHIERTLEQLLEIQGAMEELNASLTQAEGVRATWEPIGDLFIDSLPEHIQALKVCRPSLLATQTPATPPRPWQCPDAEAPLLPWTSTESLPVSLLDLGAGLAEGFSG